MKPAADLDRPYRPARSYAEAIERLGALRALDDASPLPLNPVSRTRLLTPADPSGNASPASAPGMPGPSGGEPTRRVVVCFHGLTNGPQQFATLGASFVAAGDAVLLPRLPSHGYADRLTTDLVNLTSGALLDTAAEAIDLAAGLADEVLVAGLSVGGILAAWAAQYRPVARAVAIAPSIALPLIPVALNRLVVAAALRLPNYFLWWDRRLRADLPGPTYAYPRFSTYALARIQRLGFALVGVARSKPPLARETWVVTNGADPAVNNRAADALVLNWRRAAAAGPVGQGEGGGAIRTFRFPRRLRLYHDIVDPLQPYQRVALTHPVLAQIIGQGTAPDPESLRP